MKAEEQRVTLPAKEKFHLFVLAGQSNMAGRGIIRDADRVPHPRVLALNKEGKWVPAVAPIHFDKKSAGVGLGKSFAVTLAEADEGVVIGLIPAAHGGSPLESWTPGGYHDQTDGHPYDEALARTRRAMADGVLKGILWHQGESDSRPERASVYEDNLKELIARFRKDLNAPELPFLIGQLGQFPANPWNQSRLVVNFAHMAVADSVPNAVFVNSDGLRARRDNTHFNSESLKEFGRRYAEAYLELGR